MELLHAPSVAYEAKTVLKTRKIKNGLCCTYIVAWLIKINDGPGRLFTDNGRFPMGGVQKGEIQS